MQPWPPSHSDPAILQALVRAGLRDHCRSPAPKTECAAAPRWHLLCRAAIQARKTRRTPGNAGEPLPLTHGADCLLQMGSIAKLFNIFSLQYCARGVLQLNVTEGRTFNPQM